MPVPAVVEEGRHLQGQVSRVGGNAATVIAQRTAEGERQCVVAGLDQLAGAVVQRCGQDAKARCLQRAALVDQFAGGFQLQRAGSDQGAVAVVQRAAGGACHQLATGPHQAIAQVQATALQRHALAGVHFAGLQQQGVRGQADLAGAAQDAICRKAAHDLAAVFDGVATDGDVAAGQQSATVLNRSGLQGDSGGLHAAGVAQDGARIRADPTGSVYIAVAGKCLAGMQGDVRAAVQVARQLQVTLGAQGHAGGSVGFATLAQRAARLGAELASGNGLAGQGQITGGGQAHVGLLAAEIAAAVQRGSLHVQRLHGHQTALVGQHVVGHQVGTSCTVDSAAVVDACGTQFQRAPCVKVASVAGGLQHVDVEQVRAGNVAVGEIFQRLRTQRDRCVAGNDAGIAQRAAAVQTQVTGAVDGTGVVQGARAERHALGGVQTPGVIQLTGGGGRQLATQRQAIPSLGEGARIELELLRCFQPLPVGDGVRTDAQVAVADDLASVVQLRGTQVDRLAGAQTRGGRVVDAARGVDVQRAGGQHEAAVVECTHGQAGVTGGRGAGVGQAVCPGGQCALCDELAGVGELTGNIQGDVGAGGKLGRCGLLQLPGGDGQGLRGADQPAVVDPTTDRQRGVPLAVELSPVGQAAGLDAGAGAANHHAGVVDVAVRLQLQRALRRQSRALLLHDAGGTRLQLVCGNHLPGILQLLTRAQVDVAATFGLPGQSQVAIGSQGLRCAGIEHACRVCGPRKLYVATAQPHVRTGLRRARGGEGASAVDDDVACRRRATGQLHVTRAGEDEVAARGDQCARTAHADAGLGSHQADLAGIHAAQRGNVQAEALCRSVALDRARGKAVVVDVVGTHHHVGVLGPQAGVDFHGARKQVDTLQVVCIQPRAFDADAAAANLERRQAPVAAEQRRAGGKHATGGVDEAAAVAGDAVRIGDDHLRGRAGHFHVALQQRTIAGSDFVEDQPRRLPRLQVGVALDIAGQLGLCGGRAVVEYLSLPPHVVLLVLVVRDTGGVRRGDLDHRDAIGRLLLPCLAAGLRLHLCERAEGPAENNGHYGGQQADPPAGAGDGTGNSATDVNEAGLHDRSSMCKARYFVFRTVLRAGTRLPAHRSARGSHGALPAENQQRHPSPG